MSKYCIKSGAAIEELVVGEKLGSGAVGNIFAIIAPPQFADSAVKIYLAPKAFDAEKIGTLVEKVPAQLWADLASGAQYPQYAWPQHIVYAKSTFASGLQAVGFVMPKVDLAATVALDAYFDPSSGRMKGLDGHRLALPRRVAIGINLCRLLGDLHARHVYCTDFKPKNILANRNGGQVTLLDCDGYSVVSSNGNYHPASHLSNGYVAPEVLKNKGVTADLAETQDCFALAVALFQIFNYGIFPFSGKINKGWMDVGDGDARVGAGYYPYGLHTNPAINPLPQSVHDSLPVSLRQMFDRAFLEGKGRPTAREWEDVLRGLREKARYVTCKECPTDPEHIHFADLPCCRCERDKRIGEPKAGGASPQPSDTGIGIQSTNNQPAALVEPAAPQGASPKAAFGARHWILWIVAIGLGIALLTILGNLGGDNLPTTVVRTPPSRQVSLAPDESTSGGQIATINPGMPPAGGAERKPFTREEIYYCLTREYRNDVINDILSKTNTPTPASFFSDVADYNSRCKNYAFSNQDLEAAKSTFELNKSRILDEAGAEADSFRKFFLASASNAADDAHDQGLRPDKTSDSARQKPETAQPQQPDPAKIHGAPVVSLRQEKPPASSALPAVPSADKSSQNDPPERGKAARPAGPDQARSDRAPRQELAPSSSLYTAIQRGDKATVNEYLNRGTSPNEILPNGAPLLKNAVVSSSMPVAELLLSRGADVNARDASGKTALFWARRMNNEAFVQLLLKHGAQD